MAFYQPEIPDTQNIEQLKQSRHFNPTPYPQGQLLKHCSSIWPDTYDALAQDVADILVTHDAPSCHEYGFEALDHLAQSLGVKQLFHGHHHQEMDYSKHTERMGFAAFSVPFQSIMSMDGEIIWAPKV